MKPLKPPHGVSASTIEGVEYKPAADGLVHPENPAHERILRQHGYSDPAAPAASLAPLAKPQVQAPPEPPAYFTGPYARHLAWLRENGVEVADAAPDSVVLRLTEELHASYDKPAEEAPPPPPVDAAPRRPNFNGMKAEDLAAWLKDNDVTVPDGLNRAATVKIAQDRWDELNKPKAE